MRILHRSILVLITAITLFLPGPAFSIEALIKECEGEYKSYNKFVLDVSATDGQKMSIGFGPLFEHSTGPSVAKRDNNGVCEDIKSPDYYYHLHASAGTYGAFNDMALSSY